jgi:hypothetical protein
VVNAEHLRSAFFVEGERDTYLHRIAFQMLARAALDPAMSRQRVGGGIVRVHGEVGHQFRCLAAQALGDGLAGGLKSERAEDGQLDRALGHGLYEFRVRWAASEIRRKIEGLPPQDIGGAPEAILLRVFFCTAGPKIILLLSGYDKARDPSDRRQEREIARARKLLTANRERRTLSAGGSGTGALQHRHGRYRGRAADIVREPDPGPVDLVRGLAA